MEKMLDKNWNQSLDELFSYVPPGKLKKSLHELFRRYLQTINNETDLEQFKLLAEDFYILNQFLESIEKGGNIAMIGKHCPRRGFLWLMQ